MRVIGKHHSKQYTLKNVLGQGSFGKVYHSPPYAIKEMNMVGMPKYITTALQNQVEILNRIQHPNVVRLIDSFQQSSCIYLVMEYCQEDLANYLKRKKIDQKTALQIFRQLILGFKELVSKGIIHRDLKPANILVNSKGEFKLADFGFAKFVDHYDSKLLHSMVGTPLYMSPQILGKQQYTTKSDIWSLGVILYQMICGSFPWFGMNQSQLYKNIKTRPLSVPSKVSAYSRDLLLKMLKVNQSQRISWQQLFSITLSAYNMSPQKARPQTGRDMRQQNKQNGGSPTKRRIFVQTPNKQERQKSQKKIQNQIKEKIPLQNKGKVIQKESENVIKVPLNKEKQISKNKEAQNKQNLIVIQKKKKAQTTVNIGQDMIKLIFMAEFQRLYGQQLSKGISNKNFSQFNSKQRDQFYKVQQNFNSQFVSIVNSIFKAGSK